MRNSRGVLGGALGGSTADSSTCEQNEEAPTPLTTQVAEGLKASIVGIMLSLSTEPSLQVQLGEAISIMAEADFPDKWQGLIEVRSRVLAVAKEEVGADPLRPPCSQQLVAPLSPTDYVVNNAVLQTAHSIFRRSAFQPLFACALSLT